MKRFYGTILASNLAMRYLLPSLGAQLGFKQAGVISIDMSTNPEQICETPTAQFICDVALQVRQSRSLADMPQQRKGDVTYALGGIEPPLDEVMSEPIVRTIMYYDGWAVEEAWSLVAAAQQGHHHSPHAEDQGLLRAR